jgi:SNF2 family DNA or RNA helicase
MGVMQVVTTQPFLLVYSIVDDEYLGTLIEPHVVQINSNGQLTLTHQRLFSQTADTFDKGIDKTDYELIKLLDECGHEAIFKKFHDKTSKKKIKAFDWFKKVLTPDLVVKQIRPYIERRISEILPRLSDRQVYVAGSNNNPAAQKVNMAEGHATVLFHFRRNTEGTRYFATIKHNDARVDFMKGHTRILCNIPAWVLVDDQLYHFEEHLEGRRLTPFLNKKFVEVKPESEEKYFRAFVVPLLERFDVYAEGFEIINEKHTAVPVLTLQLWDQKAVLALNFSYGAHSFLYHSNKKVHVKLEKKGDHFIFRRIKRSIDWENRKRQKLEEAGLNIFEGSMFILPEHSLTQTVDWLNLHAETLKLQGFKLEQALNKKYFLGNQEFIINVKDHRDWFDVHAVARFGEFEIPFIKLKPYILSGNREFVLPNGDIAVIPEEWLSRFGGMMEFGGEHEDGIRLKKHHIGLLEALWQSQELRTNTWQEKLKDLVEPKNVELPSGLFAELRSYQKDGFNWFCYLKENHFGGILADDMGLGKTIQTLCLLQYEKEQFQNQPVIAEEENLTSIKTGTPVQISIFDQPIIEEIATATRTIQTAPKRQFQTSLILVPTSLVYNWVNEVRKFTPELRVHVHIGQGRTKNVNDFSKFDLVITTYGVMRSDDDLFKEFEFHYIILDESQAIKNTFSATARAVMKLRAKNKLVLTGTPIENSITDLWSQMNFVNPGLLGSYQFFTDHYVIPIEKHGDMEQTRRLQMLVKPFIMRRTKAMVATDLPAKTEHLRYCIMTEAQEKLYEETKSFYRNEILKSMTDRTFSKSKLSILQGLSKLRQISNHPRMNDAEYEGGSGKFDDVTNLAQTAIAEGHKVIMFSQFVKHLDVYRKYFDEQNINYQYLDGQTQALDRKKIVDHFQKEESVKLFLISLKAGGFGLNLTAADYVFLLDPWWNPAVERQAQDRSYRIGQDKNVFIYKFISKGTIEEKILQLQLRKTDLAESIIHAEESVMKKVTAEDLLDLLA